MTNTATVKVAVAAIDTSAVMATVTVTAGLYIVLDGCTACGACLLTCPEHAFVVGVPLQVRTDRCNDCGECIEICPTDAIVRTE